MSDERKQIMNIEVANRLVEFRKKNGLSQEQLAEKIGVSRQAISKWERSEASPDTDNLILLARLYNVSLDDLLKTEDEIPMPENEKAADASGFDNTGTKEGTDYTKGFTVKDGEDKVNIGFKGIHVEDGENIVHVGWDGIHVHAKDDNCETVNIDENGVFVNGEKKDWDECCEFGCNDDWNSEKKCLLASFPYAIVCIIAFLCMGFMLANAWSWCWLVFLTIPIFHGTISAVKHRNPNRFPYAFLALIGFFCLGFFADAWHPGWVIFLTIPIYHWIASQIHRSIKRRH